MSEDDPTYEVGYGKPPKEHRWKPGTSGNPSGRKTTAKDFGVAFRKVAHKKTKFIDGRQVRTMTMLEAVMRAPLVNALKKKKGNARRALSLMEQFGTELYLLPHHPLDKIYRDYDGKLRVKSRSALLHVLERAFAEFERKDPEVAKVWLKGFLDLQKKEVNRG